MKKLPHFLKAAFIEWNRREATRMGASLAFYSLLSLAPLVVIVVGICALIFGTDRAEAELLVQFRQMMGGDAARTLEGVLKSAKQPAAGIVANAVGLLALFFGASGVLVELHTTLNELWGIRTPESSTGLLTMVKERFLSFGMVLGIGFLLLVSLVISAALNTIGSYFSNFGIPATVLETLNFIISLTVISGMFALIFRFVPDIRLPWKCVLRGGALTGILFTMGKTAIGIYLGKAGVGSAYGAAGSLVVLVVWIYYSAQIFYYGAIFTQITATTRAPNGTAFCKTGSDLPSHSRHGWPPPTSAD
jgi:membrane protein